MIYPDQICQEYIDSGLQLKLTVQDDFVHVEGTAESLLFLSKLIAAQAKCDDDSFFISPFCAGSAWFTRDSTKGLYIQRIDEQQ
jgi:hypothetical protein